MKDHFWLLLQFVILAKLHRSVVYFRNAARFALRFLYICTAISLLNDALPSPIASKFNLSSHSAVAIYTNVHRGIMAAWFAIHATRNVLTCTISTFGRSSVSVRIVFDDWSLSRWTPPILGRNSLAFSNALPNEAFFFQIETVWEPTPSLLESTLPIFLMLERPHPTAVIPHCIAFQKNCADPPISWGIPSLLIKMEQPCSSSHGHSKQIANQASSSICFSDGKLSDTCGSKSQSSFVERYFLMFRISTSVTLFFSSRPNVACCDAQDASDNITDNYCALYLKQCYLLRKRQFARDDRSKREHWRALSFAGKSRPRNKKSIFPSGVYPENSLLDAMCHFMRVGT